MASAAALGIQRLLAIWMLLSCLQDHDQPRSLWVVQISRCILGAACAWCVGDSASKIHFIRIDFCFSFIASEMVVSWWSHGHVEQILLQQFWMEALRKLANCFHCQSFYASVLPNTLLTASAHCVGSAPSAMMLTKPFEGDWREQPHPHGAIGIGTKGTIGAGSVEILEELRGKPVLKLELET